LTGNRSILIKSNDVLDRLTITYLDYDFIEKNPRVTGLLPGAVCAFGAPRNVRAAAQMGPENGFGGSERSNWWKRPSVTVQISPSIILIALTSNAEWCSAPVRCGERAFFSYH
jgi:hypothetical protein